MSAAHDNNIKKFSTQSKLSDYSTEWYYTPSSEEKKEKVLKFSKMTGTLSKMIVIEKKNAGKQGFLSPPRPLTENRKTKSDLLEMGHFFNLAFQFFVVLTPFALLSAFLVMTQDLSAAERRKVALRTGIAVIIICFAWFYFGNFIFMLFGVKIDAFRIGGGVILFLNALQMVRGNGNGNGSAKVVEGKETSRDYDDIAVVPLAIPITVGPGTTAALIVMGNETADWQKMLLNLSSLLLAILVLTTILLLGTRLEQMLSKKGITIVSKVSGLFLSAIAAQMIFEGIKNILLK